MLNLGHHARTTASARSRAPGRGKAPQASGRVEGRCGTQPLAALPLPLLGPLVMVRCRYGQADIAQGRTRAYEAGMHDDCGTTQHDLAANNPPPKHSPTRGKRRTQPAGAYSTSTVGAHKGSEVIDSSACEVSADMMPQFVWTCHLNLSSACRPFTRGLRAVHSQTERSGRMSHAKGGAETANLRLQLAALTMCLHPGDLMRPP